MHRPKVLLAEDHAIVADGLRRILEERYEVVAIVEDGHALVETAQKLRPDVIVADIFMPVLNGLDALRRLKDARFRSKVVFLTADPDIAVATQAFRAGAAGYVLKISASDELLTAIEETLKGRTYITPRIAQEVLQNLMEGGGKAPSVAEELTPREREVLQLLAEGRSAKEAAAVLNVSSRTVEFHKGNIMEKTGLRTTAELARFAAKHGLVSK